jgi:chromosome partitioning protein
MRREQRFAHRLFLEASQGVETLRGIRSPIAQSSKGSVVVADETLGDVENQVMARWLVNPEERDLRFLLRKTLRDPRVLSQSNYILLDCPPRLTTACVNALACCDYVLIPVLPDKTSTDALPRLLRWIRQLMPRCCPELKVLGVVLNRVSTRNNEPIKAQKAIIAELPNQCRDVWGKPIYQFETLIPQDIHFAEAANRNGFAVKAPSVRAVFLDFANELTRRIDRHESERFAGVPVQSQPSAGRVGLKTSGR